jgi:hypothetical protein
MTSESTILKDRLIRVVAVWPAGVTALDDPRAFIWAEIP